MSNKLDAERQISHVFSYIYAYVYKYIHMHIYDIWITLEQKGGQRKAETRERRKGEWAQKKKECWTWSKHMTHLKEIIYVTPNTEYYKNLPLKGKVQNKNSNAGKALPLSLCSALFPRSSKSTAAASILSSSHAYWCHVIMNAPCTVEWGWSGSNSSSKCFIYSRLHAVLHTSHAPAACYHASDISLLIWNLGHCGPGNLAGGWGSMQILISN